MNGEHIKIDGNEGKSFVGLNYSNYRDLKDFPKNRWLTHSTLTKITVSSGIP